MLAALFYNQHGSGGSMVSSGGGTTQLVEQQLCGRSQKGGVAGPYKIEQLTAARSSSSNSPASRFASDCLAENKTTLYNIVISLLITIIVFRDERVQISMLKFYFNVERIKPINKYTINEIMTLQGAVLFSAAKIVSNIYTYYIIQQPHCAALARQLFFENLQQQTRCLSFCLLCYCVPQSRKVNDSDPEIACLFGGLLASCCCLLDRAVACAAGLHANLHSSGIFLTIPFTHSPVLPYYWQL